MCVAEPLAEVSLHAAVCACRALLSIPVSIPVDPCASHLKPHLSPQVLVQKSMEAHQEISAGNESESSSDDDEFFDPWGGDDEPPPSSEMAIRDLDTGRQYSLQPVRSISTPPLLRVWLPGAVTGDTRTPRPTLPPSSSSRVGLRGVSGQGGCIVFLVRRWWMRWTEGLTRPGFAPSFHHQREGFPSGGEEAEGCGGETLRGMVVNVKR